jgi:hypothetical protein
VIGMRRRSWNVLDGWMNNARKDTSFKADWCTTEWRKIVCYIVMPACVNTSNDACIGMDLRCTSVTPHIIIMEKDTISKSIASFQDSHLQSIVIRSHILFASAFHRRSFPTDPSSRWVLRWQGSSHSQSHSCT